MVRARVGCSGWSYAHWRGPVYPPGMPPRRWFEHYATMFDTVELNATFYRLPSEATVRAWRDAAPDGFVYAVKVGAFGTHRMKLREPERWLARHLERARELGPFLGPNLLQLPPRWRRDAARLDAMLTVAPHDIRWAVELRDPSWLHDDVYEVLRRHGAALCLHDLIDDHPLELTADWVYLRRHGPGGPATPYRGRYGEQRLGPLAEQIEGWLGEGRDVYCYFDNDDAGFAVEDARWLAERLGVAAVAARP